MNQDYFVNNELDCNMSNKDFTRYISDLKILFEKAKLFEESDSLDKSKNAIMDSYGVFTPNVYDIQKDASEVFRGEYAEKTKEIVLRYKEIFERLSEEDINFLTGYNVEITRNRIRLFLIQQIRDIDLVLHLLN